MRESSERPMLNAFWRVAPSVRFRVFAILFAGTFFLASDLRSRTCTDVQGRLFDRFFIANLSIKGPVLVAVSWSKEKPRAHAVWLEGGGLAQKLNVR